MSNLRLHKALKIQKQKTQQVEQEIYGSLGIPLGGRKLTDVPDRPSFVYVRLRDNQNEVVQAFNNKVTSSYNLPVILHREGTRYIIDSVNTQRYQNNWNNSAAYLPRHGTNHSFYEGGGGDVTWVYSRQIMPYLIYPESTTTGSSLKMASHTFLDTNNQWKVVGGTGTPSLLQYLPTGGNDAIMGLLYLDAPTGNPKLIINSGTPFSNLLTGTGDIYPYIPVPNINTQIPLAAVRLSSGTNYINWDNLYDVRQWLQVAASGTSSGGGGGVDTIGFAGLADGLPIGTGTTLNVHGAAFTRSGTVFDLNITGSSASVVVPVSGTFVVQNNGQTLGSVTTLNFTNGVTASISGSVAQISVTGTASYVRTAPPVSLSTVTGTYWRTQESIFVSGSLALFNQGHALIPAIDYLEQYPVSGTFQYISTPPTGTYNLAIYGVPIAGASNGSGGGGSSSPGALVLLNTLTAGGSASLNDTTSLSSSYDDYMIELIGLVPVNNLVDFYIRFSSNGGVSYNSTGSVYQNNNLLQATTGNVSITSALNQFPIRNNTEVVNTTTKGVNGSLKLFDPLSTRMKMIVGNLLWSGGSNYINTMMHGTYLDTAPVNALTFLFSSGNIATGTVRIYGIAKS